eukprot:TRINITY_DN3018_c0_g1_i1.p2 TRINITY_DN3018_c0_g1~~TRINITY_DN3018_c0_g1_i1.p2  ORF type:complete len:125 (+),score=57.95 TRINITY_DN3018_c0_g1_i1:32-376(+)
MSLLRVLMRASPLMTGQPSLALRAAPVAKKASAKKKKKRLHQVSPNEEHIKHLVEIEKFVEKEGVPEWFSKLWAEVEQVKTGPELTEEDGAKYLKYQNRLKIKENNKARSKKGE